MALFKWLREKMLPSPTKFHYTFTLKDLSRLFQGVLRTPKSTYTQDNVLVQLWRHEAERVFSDKLVNLQDKDKFKKELDLVSKQLTGAAPVCRQGEKGPAAIDLLGSEVADEARQVRLTTGQVQGQGRYPLALKSAPRCSSTWLGHAATSTA